MRTYEPMQAELKMLNPIIKLYHERPTEENTLALKQHLIKFMQATRLRPFKQQIYELAETKLSQKEIELYLKYVEEIMVHVILNNEEFDQIVAKIYRRTLRPIYSFDQRFDRFAKSYLFDYRNNWIEGNQIDPKQMEPELVEFNHNVEQMSRYT